MNTTKRTMIWKRGLCAALTLLMLLLSACGAKADTPATAAVPATTAAPATTEAPASTTAPETVQPTEAPSTEPVKTEPPATEAPTAEPTEPQPTEPTEFVPDPNWPTGSCGDDLTWYFDAKSGRLTIVGSGDMVESDQNHSEDFGVTSPWQEYREQIKTISLPEGLTSIGNFAFYDCMALTSVTIPANVTFIGEEAFGHCKQLTQVTLQCGAVDVRWDVAFRTCVRLKEFVVPTDNPAYSSVDGVLFDRAQTKLIYYPFAKTTRVYHVPDGVTEIGEAAFLDQDNMIGVIIPDSVTEIGDNAFAGCGKLKDVTIGSGVTRIGEDAFLTCGLSEVTIPETVREIGAHAFGYALYSKYISKSDFVVRGAAGSAAENYAKENGFTFVAP